VWHRWTFLTATYAILDTHTNEAIAIGIDELAHIFPAITNSIAPAMYPDKDW
jgi:hypothetical protein